MTDNSILQQRITPRVLVNIAIHMVVFIVVYIIAYLIAFKFELPADELTKMVVTCAGVLCVKTAIFFAGGHCHRSWRYISFSDLGALLWSATICSISIFALDYFLSQPGNHISKRALAADWGLTILVLGGMRATARLFREEIRPRLFGKPLTKLLIVGANKSGEIVARHLVSEKRMKYHVLGYLDDDRALHGSTISGLPVLGRATDAFRYADALAVHELLVISGILTGKQLRELLANCEEAGIALKVIPEIDDLLDGSSGYASQIRNVDINDLLRREPVQLSGDAIANLLGEKTIMVTGAGGSIGSEICRQVLRFHPTRLVLVEQAENSLFQIEQELIRSHVDAELIPCIADVTDRDRMEQLFREHRPEILFHAAAHKHVPMMEHNPGEALKNNVQGTMQLAELADEFGVHEFVMISTDKAVNPTSVMGVSKQIAERFVHALSESATTKFVVVRFGNVLASNGSVVPIFQEQIRRGGPITVTHPDIERFFMTIPEAAQLVLQAASMGKGGEIFVLDMGEPVRIVDLARDLIRLSGLKEDDIDIVFSGLRPGEKLYEELYFESEEMLPTQHPKVFVARHRVYELAEVRNMIGQLAQSVHQEPDAVRQLIQKWIPEYDPNGLNANQTESKPICSPKDRVPQRRTMVEDAPSRSPASNS